MPPTSTIPSQGSCPFTHRQRLPGHKQGLLAPRRPAQANPITYKPLRLAQGLQSRPAMKPSLAILALLPALATSAQAYSVSCVRSSYYDADGDGYAMAGTPESAWVTMDVSGADRLSCPAGWVRRGGDCNDWNPNVHPRNPEIQTNNIDDNCDGRADEPTFVFSEDRARVSPSTATIALALNDAGTLAWRYSLWVSASYVLLNDSSTVRWAWAALTPVPGNPNESTFTITGLPPSSVLAVKEVYVYAWISYPGSYVFMNSAAPELSLYTTTDGTTSEERARTSMVLRALKQLGEDAQGRVGYRGSSQMNGTRYGAGAGDLWCSEFYGWSGRPSVFGYNTFFGFMYLYAYSSTVATLEYYFSVFNALHSGSTIPTLAKRADYIAMNTKTNAPDDPNHSGMFLAYDARLMEVWTVEGNVGNTVSIGRAPLNVNRQRSLGHLTTTILH